MLFNLFAISFLVAGATSAAVQAVISQSQHQEKFEEIRRKLIKSNIISDVVDDFYPKCFVTPVYKKNKVVALGNKIKESKTHKKPDLKIFCPGMEYTPGLTIAVSDPDARKSKKDPKYEMCHWIAVAEAINVNPKNSTGLDFEVSLTSNKKDIVDYKSPAPPKKTGHHRYVFTLLEGVNTNFRVPAERKNFGAGENGHGVQDWAKNQSLQVIGANWFLEKHETVYVGVPAIY